jgi:hypothetical protein
MDTSILRLLAHSAAIALITAAIFAIVVARHNIPHWRLIVAGLILLDFWVIFLALSVHSAAFFPREQLVPLLAILELGAVALGWSWFVMTVRWSFRIKRSAVLLDS